MPDGTNAPSTGTENEQPPGTPEEQVNQEINGQTGVFGWWRSLFGTGEPYEAGGGGTGGQFMFASLEELDSLIKRWEDERDGIQRDKDAIADAYHMIKDPAADVMSRVQASASKDSVANMWHHSDAMLRYAENYIQKLKDSRAQIQVMEDGAHDQMRSVQA
ncbi:hypothetical protein [Actinophytocola sp.]|uniref:hypothetical protein n=1 Tax=Actinophytocola sp. TaxID=1872138 RepID=UPI002ED4798C